MDNNTEVHDLTSALPTMENDTRSIVKKTLLAVTAAGAALLALDAGVKKLRSEKSIKVVVVDTGSSES